MTKVAVVEKQPIGQDADHPSSKVERRSSLIIPIVLIFGALLYGTIRQGAFYRHQFTIFGALMLASAAVLIAQRRPMLARRLWVIAPFGVAVAISAFSSGGWSAASTAWVVGMIAAFGAWHLAALADEEEQQLLIIGVQLVALVVAATSIWGVVDRRVPWARQIGDVWRGESTLTYANATAALLLVVLIPTMALAVVRNSRLLAALCVVIVVGLASTGSRTGWLLLAFGGLAQIALARNGRSQMRHAWVVLAAASSLPSVVVLMRSSATSAIPRFIPLMAIAVGVGLAAALWGRMHERMLFGGGLAALAGGLVIPSVRDALVPIARNRLDPASLFTRLEEWAAAVRVWSNHPLTGAGPGNAALSFERDGQNFIALFAHNEFLQVGAELGVLGFATLTIVLVAAGRPTVLAGVRRAGDDAEQSAVSHAGVIAAGVFVLHSSLDFLWHLPVLVVVAALVVGLAANTVDRPMERTTH